VKPGEIQVYEYGQETIQNALSTYSYTYSYTPISSFLVGQLLLLGSTLPSWEGQGWVPSQYVAIRLKAVL
jgi:hypothetical protein